MPYPDQERRKRIRGGHAPGNAEELGYRLTMECWRYLRANDEGYRTHAEILAALELTKAEILRRWLAPAEEARRAQNGDVTP